jgi:hypothetical protein
MPAQTIEPAGEFRMIAVTKSANVLIVKDGTG